MEMSPIAHASKVEAPVFLMLGKGDLRVPHSQGIEYWCVLYSKAYLASSCKEFASILLEIFFVCGEAQTMEWWWWWWFFFFFFFFFFLLLALLSYYRIYARYRKTYKNKSVDKSEIRYCAKFQTSVTCIFTKKMPKTFLHVFYPAKIICLFDLQNDLKIQF